MNRKLPWLNRLIQQVQDLQTEKGILQLEKGNLEATIRDQESIINSKRNFLAERYLNGRGIEIGAAQLPVRLPKGVSVKYVDVFTSQELKKAYPLYKKLDIVNVDVVDDGEKLAKFKDGSLDFIIANHFLEHCLNPIGTVLNMYKKLRKNGVLYMAIPDKRYTFDKLRPITSYNHLLKEYKYSNQKFRKEHTTEYIKAILGKKATPTKVKQQVEELLKSDYRIHYHVWRQQEMTEMFSHLSENFNVDFEIEALLKNYHEIIYILRKQSPHQLINYTPQM